MAANALKSNSQNQSPVFPGNVVATLMSELQQLCRELEQRRSFDAAVASAIKRHPEMSVWIGDEQERALLPAAVTVAVKSKRSKQAR